MARLDDTLGALFVGLLCAVLLGGTVCFLAFLYFTHYPNDCNVLRRAYVPSLWFLAIAQLALLSHAVYDYLITYHDSPSALVKGIPTLYTSILISIILAVASKCYFIYRISRVTSPSFRWWLVGFASILTLAQLGFGSAMVAELFLRRRLTEFRSIKQERVPYSVASFLSDCALAVPLSTFLYNQGFGKGKTNGSTAVLYSVNRLVLLCIIDAAGLALSAATPSSLWSVALNTIAGQVSALSVLGALNTRPALKGRGVDEEDIARLQPPTVHWRHSLILKRAQQAASPTHSIGVDSFARLGTVEEGGESSESVLDISAEKSRKARLNPDNASVRSV